MTFHNPTGQELKPLYLRILVTDDERALIKRAAAQPGWSVSTWANVNLVTLAEIETAGTTDAEGS